LGAIGREGPGAGGLGRVAMGVDEHEKVAREKACRVNARPFSTGKVPRASLNAN
jgi:hypothetical protein